MELRRLTESFPGRVARKFNEDQGPKHAALIAWNALTAVFPMVLFMASILGFALSFAGFKAGAFYTDVAALFPDSSVQQEVFKALDGVKSRTGLLFAVGLAGMLWGGSNLFGAMEDSFASIYHTRNRGFLGQKLLAFAMMLIFTVLAGSIVLSSTLLPAVEKLPYVPGFLRAGPAAFALQLLLGLAFGYVLFSTIYFIVPNRRQSYQQVWAGSLLASVLFELLTLAFPLYMTHANVNSYGKTFGLLFVLITYLYALGLITMLGVEVNSVLYPLPVEQPDRAAVLAPPQSGIEGERVVRPSPTASRSRAWEESAPVGQPTASKSGRRSRVRTVLALLGASGLGVLLGRRTREGK